MRTKHFWILGEPLGEYKPTGVGDQQLPPAQPILGLARRGQSAVCQRSPGQPHRWQ